MNSLFLSKELGLFVNVVESPTQCDFTDGLKNFSVQ